MEENETKPESPTIETLLADNASIKADLEETKKKLADMLAFNKALLNRQAPETRDPSTTAKENARAKIYNFIHERSTN